MLSEFAFDEFRQHRARDGDHHRHHSIFPGHFKTSSSEHWIRESLGWVVHLGWDKFAIEGRVLSRNENPPLAAFDRACQGGLFLACCVRGALRDPALALWPRAGHQMCNGSFLQPI